MNLRYLPNALTFGRIILVAPTFYFLVERQFLVGLILFAIAGLSDAIDGFLAKRFGWVTRLGGMLDPIADKFLLVASTFALVLVDQIPVWLFVLIVVRDLVILSGATAYYFLIAKFDASPTLLSKLTTVMQITLVIAVVLEALQVLPPQVTTAVVMITAAVTVASGLQYIVMWGLRAYRALKWRTP